MAATGDGEEVDLVPASAEEKALLKGFVARDATEEERDGFLQSNVTFLSDKAKRAFMDMSAKDQFRVIADGPMTSSQDSTEILYGRVKRFKDMETQVRNLAHANYDAPKGGKAEERVSNVSMQIAQAMANPVFEEVPESERRCTPAAVAQPAGPEDNSKLEGDLRGVGGVVEALQKKYGLQKGERVRVVAETKELWKLEGEKTVPKAHSNSGWKWVLKGAEEEAKKKALELARKKMLKEEAKKREEEEKKKREAAEAKRKRKRKKSSGSSEDAKKDKTKKKAKDGKKTKKKQDVGSESSEGSSVAERRPQSRKSTNASKSRGREVRRDDESRSASRDRSRSSSSASPAAAKRKRKAQKR
mmetsp:Transcript_21532/g.50191  ORF Transcript_21532/g.50191 Transcript_21532/m.50191 type:complete len:359 (-) Transcript_21532:204-1280(-)